MLARDFNMPNSNLQVLIIMYNVRVQGFNLYKSCHRVLVAIPENNLAKQLQAMGNLLRVGKSKNLFGQANICQITQRHEVTVICARVQSFHSGFKEYKQSDKALVELAIRAHESCVRKLLIKLLQAYRHEIVVAHSSSKGQAILANIKDAHQSIQKLVGQKSAISKAAKVRSGKRKTFKAQTTEDEAKSTDQSNSQSTSTTAATPEPSPTSKNARSMKRLVKRSRRRVNSIERFDPATYDTKLEEAKFDRPFLIKSPKTKKGYPSEGSI